ncbi:MAG TPA: hypothetical protein VKD04_14220 [Burkholderiales bacterium]|nr:hypothetical protein [Burkholderiales bacterium]
MAIPRLEARLHELEQLDVASISSGDDHRVEELSARIRSTLSRIYGEDSLEFARLSDAADLNRTYEVLNLAGIDYSDGPSPIDIRNGLSRGRSRAISLLRAELDVLREDLAQIEATETPRSLPPTLSTHTPPPPFEAVWSKAAHRPKAFADPTINDFLAMIDRPLQKAIEQAQAAVEQVKRDAARRSSTYRVSPGDPVIAFSRSGSVRDFAAIAKFIRRWTANCRSSERSRFVSVNARCSCPSTVLTAASDSRRTTSKV